MKLRMRSVPLAVILTAILRSGALPPAAHAGDDGAAGSLPEPELATGHVPVWRVTFMKSRSGMAINSTTVITVVNQGSSSCSTSVDWPSACTTTLAIGPGQALEHCSRNLPPEVVGCNAICNPELTFVEGSAIVGMQSTCKTKVAVYPRIYYTGAGDANVTSVADVKLVKIGKSNSGD